MTRIGNMDHVLLLLRERLQRSGRGRESTRKTAAGGVAAATAGPLQRLRALTALDSLSEDEVRRAVVRGLLREEMGEAVENDPAFQRIVDDVVRIIGEAPGGPELIDLAVAQLRDGS